MKNKNPKERKAPTLKLKAMFRWVEMDDNGHIKLPRERRQYAYDDSRMFDDFPTEEDAIEALRKKVEGEDGGGCNDLILVRVFITTYDYS